MKTDIVIVGSGVSGLFSALNLPSDKHITLITKSDLESSDSFLAQGGICVQRDDGDFDSYFEDTMKAGHYENRKESVKIMIEHSREIIQDLVRYGVDFETENGTFAYTREGAHSKPRILFHEDITGKEITSKLLTQVKRLKNVTLYEYTTMKDLLVDRDNCLGIIAEKSGELVDIYADYTILASGGIGGRYTHSTNFPHLTGDALNLAEKYNIRLEHLDYVQIHPTTLYSEKPGRRFLISESVRGEGAVLYNKDGKRFIDELLPRVELICKEDGVIAGLPVFERVFHLLDAETKVELFCKDGDKVQKGQLMGKITGDIRVLLSGERVALNFLQRMSGIATYTRQVADLLDGANIQLLDTRKTTPNMRIFEKYAVRVGGGHNHRYNLSDGVLLKDNHIGAAGSVTDAVRMAKEYAPFVRKIEVEVETLDMVKEAVEAGADIIMLDNMTTEEMKEAIRIIDGRAQTECSGNVTKENIQKLTSLGIDYVSSGALTHSSPILDISLKNLHVV